MASKKMQGLLIFVLIVFLLCIVFLTYCVFELLKSNEISNNAINQLDSKVESLETSLNSISSSSNSTQNTIGESETSNNDNITDKLKIEEVAKKFVKAVNGKSWGTVEDLSSAEVLNRYNEI